MTTMADDHHTLKLLYSSKFKVESIKFNVSIRGFIFQKVNALLFRSMVLGYDFNPKSNIVPYFEHSHVRLVIKKNLLK